MTTPDTYSWTDYMYLLLFDLHYHVLSASSCSVRDTGDTQSLFLACIMPLTFFSSSPQAVHPLHNAQMSMDICLRSSSHIVSSMVQQVLMT